MPGMHDRFTFWGWSSDGARFAFETYMPGEGGVSCDMVHDVFVVDARTDDFAAEGRLSVGYDWPEGGPNGCQPPDLKGRVAVERPGFLAGHGITVGRLLAPEAMEAADQGFVASGESFTFEVLHGTDDAYGEAAAQGAAYRLVRTTGGLDQVLEPGTRRRSYVLDYAPAWLFRSPDGVHAAVVVKREHSAFEGTRWSYMANGFALSTSAGTASP